MNEKLNRRRNLLIDTLSIQTSSGKEQDMIAYITDFCKTNVPHATIKVHNNNIYVTKGKSKAYPCIVAHTDTVHDIHKYYKVFEDDGCLFAFNAETGKQVGVGGDDKVGIWIALEMLMSFDKIKCAFFHSEEMGCIGSSQADMKWFKDVGYCLQADRRGNTDFVNSISGKLYSKAFKKAIKPILKEYGYKETSGAITDVGQLAANGIGVCTANMSCGYYEPHSDEEIVEFDDSNKCLDMVEMIVSELGRERYEFTFAKRAHRWGNYGSEWGDFKGASRDYWYGDYGTATKEVVYDEKTGEECCYYCGCANLMESQFVHHRFCPGCCSDISLGEDNKEIKDPNQTEMDFYDEQSWNKSFGVTNRDCGSATIEEVEEFEEVDYKDISDNYDDSLEHRAIVNEYLKNK